LWQPRRGDSAYHSICLLLDTIVQAPWKKIRELLRKEVGRGGPRTKKRGGALEKNIGGVSDDHGKKVEGRKRERCRLKKDDPPGGNSWHGVVGEEGGRGPKETQDTKGRSDRVEKFTGGEAGGLSVRVPS